jgi:DNA-binding CsgD family transcriptional regulator
MSAVPDLPRCLDVLAAILAGLGRPEQAAHVWGAAEALEEAVGAVSEVHLDYTLELEAARTSLGEHAFAAAWANGRGLTLDQAVGEALMDQPAPRSADPEALTAREREVVALLAGGCTNRQIAEVLLIGERTVETHVGNVLAKLGLASRVLVGPWAAEHGIVPRSASEPPLG